MKPLMRWRYGRWIALVMANLIYFSLVNPEGSRSFVLFGGFCLLAIDIFLLLRLVLLVIEKLSGKEITLRSRLSLLGTLVIVILLALQSIGQLSVRDAIAVLCVGVVCMFYSSYYRFGQRR